METEQDHVARRVAAFTDAHHRSLTVLATAIHRATGDDDETCFARAWLLFRWARVQQEPKAAAAAIVRRMNEERRAGPRSIAPSGCWQSFYPAAISS